MVLLSLRLKIDLITAPDLKVSVRLNVKRKKKLFWICTVINHFVKHCQDLVEIMRVCYPKDTVTE